MKNAQTSPAPRLSSVVVVVLVALAVFAGSACTTVRQARAHETLVANGKAEKTRSDDALDYSVATVIAAPPEVVWAVLTDAPGYRRWNSTVQSLEGVIAQDQTVHLTAKVAPDQVFSLQVSTFAAPKQMVWEDGNGMFLGVRTFSLRPNPDGVVFAMSETFSGAMLGMIEGSLPDFTADFEAFAADLKKEAEARTSTSTSTPPSSTPPSSTPPTTP